MAKFYISADLEGVCGVTNPLQCYPKEDRSGFEWAVRQMAAEVNAVAETILTHDPDADIVVNDAHSAMINLSLEMVSPRVRLLSGKPKLCAMVAGLDNTFDAAVFIGYHAKAGTKNGVLNHTYHGKLYDIQVNGVSYGEGGINALFASLVHQVPLILASGDWAFCHEITALVRTVQTVETKVGLTTTAANSHPREAVLQGLRDKTAQLLRNRDDWQMNLLMLDPPFTLRIAFTHTLACDVVSTSPLYHRIDGRTVEVTMDSFAQVFQMLQAAYTMLAYTNYMDAGGF